MKTPFTLTLSRRLLHQASALLIALAVGGLLFPPALFAQPASSTDLQEILRIDRKVLEDTEGLPSHLRVTDPATDRDLLLIKADQGYYYSDLNDPALFGYFDFSQMEGAAKVQLGDGGEIVAMTIPTRDASGALVDSPVEVSTDPETGALAVWLHGQEVPSKRLSAVAGPDFLIHAGSEAADKGIIVIISILLVIIGCIISLDICISPCIAACQAAGKGYVGFSATGCGRITCDCECEEMVPEVNPACV